MKDVNGIQTPFDNAIVPVPGGKGVGATDIGGVNIPDGQKGVSGDMPEVSGVTLPDTDNPGTGRPSGISGS